MTCPRSSAAGERRARSSSCTSGTWPGTPAGSSKYSTTRGRPTCSSACGPTTRSASTARCARTTSRRWPGRATRATGTPPSAGCSRSATSPGSATLPTAGRWPGTAVRSARAPCDSDGRSNLKWDQGGAGIPGGVLEVLTVAFVAVLGFVDGDTARDDGGAVLLAFFPGLGVGEAGPDGVVQVEALA